MAARSSHNRGQAWLRGKKWVVNGIGNLLYILLCIFACFRCARNKGTFSSVQALNFWCQQITWILGVTLLANGIHWAGTLFLWMPRGQWMKDSLNGLATGPPASKQAGATLLKEARKKLEDTSWETLIFSPSLSPSAYPTSTSFSNRVI